MQLYNNIEMSDSPRSNDSEDWTFVSRPNSSRNSPSRLGDGESTSANQDVGNLLAISGPQTTSSSQQTNPLDEDYNSNSNDDDAIEENVEQAVKATNDGLVDIDLNDDSNSFTVQQGENRSVSTSQTQTCLMRGTAKSLNSLRSRAASSIKVRSETFSVTPRVSPTVRDSPISEKTSQSIGALVRKKKLNRSRSRSGSNSSSNSVSRPTDPTSKRLFTPPPEDEGILSLEIDSMSSSSSAGEHKTLKSETHRFAHRLYTDDEFRKNVLDIIITTLFMSTLLLISVYVMEYAAKNFGYNHPSSKESLNLVDTDISQHAYVELKMMSEELDLCIKRENLSLKDYEDKLASANPLPYSPGHKPYVGFVCYEDEEKWRKRFDRLKRDFDLDFRNILRQARKRITSDVLASYHPSLNFKLIQNQLEYVDYMDERRDKFKQELLIRQLKAENAQLRQFRDPNDSEVQRAVIGLENENVKLKREIETLRNNLAEKTGTVYVRQSLELERCDRENNALKEFHHHISQDISKSLRKLNLHTIDASTIAHDDLGSLNSQLTITRGYLQRLTEELDGLISRNEALRDDLKFAYSLYSKYDNTDESGFIGNHMLNAISSDSHPSIALSSVIAQGEVARSAPQKGENQSESSDGSSQNTIEDLATRLENESKLEFRPDWSLKRSKLRERLRKSVDNIDYSCHVSKSQKDQNSNSEHNSSYNRRTGKESNYRCNDGSNMKIKKPHQYHHHDNDRSDNYKQKKSEKRTNHERQAKHQYISSFA